MGKRRALIGIGASALTLGSLFLSGAFAGSAPQAGQSVPPGLPKQQVQAAQGVPIPAHGIIPNPALDVLAPPSPSPWAQYLTQVTPDSPIGFASSSIGWSISGMGSQPSLDHFLAAGVSAENWPGTSLLSTTDGGMTWHQVLTDPNGLWGVDVLDSSHAWVVGVTDLYATTDGTDWSQLGEPTGTALVNVAFSTPESGIGLTTNGSLVATSDGGVAWSAVGGSPAGLSDLCRETNGALLVDDQAGNVWSVNVATAQVQIAATFSSPLSEEGSMAVLSCGQGTPPWEEIAPNQPGGSTAVTIVRGLAGSWSSATAPNAPSSSGIGVVARVPVVGAPDPLLTTTMQGPPAGAIYEATTGTSFALVSTPHLFDGTVPTSAAGSTYPTSLTEASAEVVAVHGIDFLNAQIGWLVADINAVTASSAAARSSGDYFLIFSTTNGGSSWEPIYETEAAP